MVHQPEFSQDGDFNNFLKKLAIEAQQHPRNSARRGTALTRLIHEIKKSGQLFYPPRGEWSANIYADLKDEALSDTWLTIFMDIEKYDPEQANVMTWVNSTILKYKFKDAEKKYRQDISTPSLDDLELDIPAEETSSHSRSLYEFLKTDPEGLLQKKCMKEWPEINFQWLALRRCYCTKNSSWEQISKDTKGIPPTSLCSFFQRSLEKLIPYFRKYLEE